jgi:hypothetical protein
MSRMPKWDVDICIVDCGKKGRGLKMLKTVHKGDPIGSTSCCHSCICFVFRFDVCAQIDMAVIWLMQMETLFMKERPFEI